MNQICLNYKGNYWALFDGYWWSLRDDGVWMVPPMGYEDMDAVYLSQVIDADTCEASSSDAAASSSGDAPFANSSDLPYAASSRGVPLASSSDSFLALSSDEESTCSSDPGTSSSDAPPATGEAASSDVRLVPAARCKFGTNKAFGEHNQCTRRAGGRCLYCDLHCPWPLNCGTHPCSREGKCAEGTCNNPAPKNLQQQGSNNKECVLKPKAHAKTRHLQQAQRHINWAAPSHEREKCKMKKVFIRQLIRRDLAMDAI